MLTDRRAFLGSLIGGLAAGAAVRTWPFRVYSFPREVRFLGTVEVEFDPFLYLTKEEFRRRYIEPTAKYFAEPAIDFINGVGGYKISSAFLNEYSDTLLEVVSAASARSRSSRQ